MRVVLVDHNVDNDFPAGAVVEVLDHHVSEMLQQPSARHQITATNPHADLDTGSASASLQRSIFYILHPPPVLCALGEKMTVIDKQGGGEDKNCKVAGAAHF